MKLNKDKLKKINGYYEGTIDAIDAASSQKALDYKKNFLKKFYSINQKQIDSRFGGDTYYCTWKYNGEYANIFFDGKGAFTVNRSGRTRYGIPCIDEAAKLLIGAGIKQAIIPAEIYLYDTSKRTRTDDLISVLAGEKKIGRLKLAAFDILELDNKEFKPETYEDTISKLNEILKGGELVHPVIMKKATSIAEIKAIYKKWVEEQNAEGIVVRSQLPFVYKIKPRHNIDVVIVGFTEGTGDQKGRIRSLLVALMPEDGKYQVIGKVGGGMTDKLKKELFKKLSAKIINSDFIDTDSNHVAFRMIEPDTIMEIVINDVIYESSAGLLQNTILEIEKGTYKVNAIVAGFSFIAPVFEKIREDKEADASDIRITQINSFSIRDTEEINTQVVDKSKTKKSELLVREVFKKEAGAKVMVQKYLIWKTNKEETGDYPAYVFFYTNFSSERNEPLQTDVTISNDKKQLVELMKKAQQENVKQGWHKIG